MHAPDPSLPQVIDDCHELLKWLVPLLDKFPRARRFTLGEMNHMGSDHPNYLFPFSLYAAYSCYFPLNPAFCLQK